MCAETAHDTSFSFHLHTWVVCSSRALDGMRGILRDAGIEYPLWVLPQKSVHHRAVSRILKQLYGRTGTQTVSLDTLTAEDQVIEIAQHCKAEGYDGFVLCGDESDITKGKHIASLSGSDHPIVLVPFGELSGSEFLGHDPASRIPISAVLDGRLTKLTTLKNTARSVCFALLQTTTALIEQPNPLMLSTAESAFTSAQEALDHMVEPAERQSGFLSAILCVYFGGMCAQNRKSSAIIDFSQRLAIEGLADSYESAAAILPYVCTQLQNNQPEIYETIKQAVGGMDPIEFVRTWVSLSDPQGTDRIIALLCGDMHDLLTHPRNIRELQPLLSLFPESGGAS
jgi:hypothetical protein